MLDFLGKIFTGFMKKYLPDPLIFAFLLTILTLILGIRIQGKSLLEMTGYMGDGFLNLLSSAMQMCIILMTGHILASTRPMKRILQSTAKTAKTPSMI